MWRDARRWMRHMTYSHVSSLEVESLEAIKHHRQEKGQVSLLSVQVRFCFGAIYLLKLTHWFKGTRTLKRFVGSSL